MLETTKELLANQFEASFRTLHACVETCPDSAWDMPIGIYPLNQVVFHTLFFTDYYLETDAAHFREQSFHREHQAFFDDYEQLEYRKPVGTYDRPSLQTYLQHCRHKASRAIAAESAETLSAPCGFQRRDFSRAELHVYTIRHIQHHSAQLILRLRMEASLDFPWFASGWQD